MNTAIELDLENKITLFQTKKYYVAEFCDISGLYTLKEFNENPNYIWRSVSIQCFCKEDLIEKTEVEGYLKLQEGVHLLGDWEFPELILLNHE